MHRDERLPQIPKQYTVESWFTHCAIRLCDPITGNKLVDPVITPSGRTYERESIEKYIEQHKIEPWTNQPLQKEQLVVNRKIQEVVDALKKQDTKRDDFEELLNCPITFETMKDPVITPDGNSFEREIFKKYHSDPFTRRALVENDLIPNIALRELIQNLDMVLQQAQTSTAEFDVVVSRKPTAAEKAAAETAAETAAAEKAAAETAAETAAEKVIAFLNIIAFLNSRCDQMRKFYADLPPPKSGFLFQKAKSSHAEEMKYIDAAQGYLKAGFADPLKAREVMLTYLYDAFVRDPKLAKNILTNRNTNDHHFVRMLVISIIDFDEMTNNEYKALSNPKALHYKPEENHVQQFIKTLKADSRFEHEKGVMRKQYGFSKPLKVAPKPPNPQGG